MSKTYTITVNHTTASTCTGPHEYLQYKKHEGKWHVVSTSPTTLHLACAFAAMTLGNWPGMPLGKYKKEVADQCEAAREIITNIYIDLANKQFAKGPIAYFRNTVDEACVAHISVDPNA